MPRSYTLLMPASLEMRLGIGMGDFAQVRRLVVRDIYHG